MRHFFRSHLCQVSLPSRIRKYIILRRIGKNKALTIDWVSERCVLYSQGLIGAPPPPIPFEKTVERDLPSLAVRTRAITLGENRSWDPRLLILFNLFFALGCSSQAPRRLLIIPISLLLSQKSVFMSVACSRLESNFLKQLASWRL